ncbi:RNA methyltransferase, TrmH family, group 1 [Candidatus Methanoperedens nitroreducens]|uniref:RNA methyltransferase, TrmH family, group 1 n=2 Tax=Candidatus Methanoperedens nitratireducens TaxID=1392998 RepID=A0A062V201_9EURY|nr:RNA methyltransferase, TrmH family, group 1 [Candidatus Methanoperedens nitroreducens]MDJ1420515.1 RNA methyltransferase [Candidatus Methanoperedens sp.]
MELSFRVILVEPIYSGNVGSVARVMKNFGFNELILLNPCELDMPARLMAMHAYDLIESARIVSSLKEAIEGSNIVVGMTGLPGRTDNRHIRMPALSPRKLRDKLSGKSGVVSLLFGREDDGLRNDELELCDIIVTIPTDQEYPSMNLSHAAAVVLYELSDVGSGDTCMADRFDIELLYEHLNEVLSDIEYKEHKKDKTRLMLQRILGRAELTGREVQTLRGVLRRIQWKLDKK